jgi:hypothetical protein
VVCHDNNYMPTFSLKRILYWSFTHYIPTDTREHSLCYGNTNFHWSVMIGYRNTGSYIPKICQKMLVMSGHFISSLFWRCNTFFFQIPYKMCNLILACSSQFEWSNVYRVWVLGVQTLLVTWAAIKMIKKYSTLFVCLKVFNATFNNISAISWWSVLLVEESRGPGENHRPVASHWQTLSHTALSSTPRHEWGSNSQLKWW